MFIIRKRTNNEMITYNAVSNAVRKFPSRSLGSNSLKSNLSGLNLWINAQKARPLLQLPLKFFISIPYKEKRNAMWFAYLSKDILAFTKSIREYATAEPLIDAYVNGKKACLLFSWLDITRSHNYRNSCL